MHHLSSEALLDLSEDAAAASLDPHLTACAVCRQQVEDLRGVMAAVSVDVPEPSPLFWDHLSARVREAVAAEPVPATALAILRGSWGTWRLAAVACAAVVVLAVGVSVRRPGTERAPDVAVVAATVASAGALVAETGGTIVDDPSLSLLVDLTGGLDWDGAAEAGLDVDAGSADGAVSDLTADERVELRRLLNQALAGSGA